MCLPPPAVELAMIMDRLYGGVCYAGIDTDPELKYPKGAGRVAFSNQQSYIAAISARFVQLQHGEIDKRVSGEKRELSVFLSPPSPLPFFLHSSPHNSLPVLFLSNCLLRSKKCSMIQNEFAILDYSAESVEKHIWQNC